MPQLTDYPRFAWQLLSGWRSEGERRQFLRLQQDVAPYLDMSQPRAILDLANGRLRPQYTLMRAAGHRVVGVDFANRPTRSPINLAYSVARRAYTWRLGLPASAMAATHLLMADVGRLPFADHHFDLVSSAAAFEHFLEVPRVVAELKRVLRPGGVIWTSIHLFSSPSGGHNLSFTEFPIRSIPEGVDAWDHLRKRRLPFRVPLNEWRAEQFLDCFAEHFEVITSYCAAREGEALLTPAIEQELAGYSRDELTCAAFVIVARKA
ncbi:MAG: hypothetical protein OHK0050_13350 [Roseiflexaceae bacterium]